MEFIDLKTQYKMLKNEIDINIKNIIESAKFIGGPQVGEFEEKLGSFIGRKYCITCASGTDALELAYLAYGVGEGDAVFCPDMTFIASIEPACMLGATPVFCDIEPDTYNISPRDLEEKVKSVIEEGGLTPKAVVAVDFLGNPAKHEEISEICKKYGMIHIEDGAQSTGGSYHNRKCGSFGDIATTSFFPSKPLGCYGDGGAVFTDDDEIADIIKSLKVHGKGPKGKYENVRIGVNSRLDTIQAGVLLPKLDALSGEIAKRQEIAKIYDNAFKDKLQIPIIEEESISAYAQYCVMAKSKEQREAILEKLKEAGVPSLLYYPNPLHILEAFEPYPECKMPNTKKYAECNFGLPFSPYLTKEDQELVINTVLSAIE
ncbi:MAG: DegT/DnrJ/EryC1/StrS family aminotransferase [Firmicutes bacterium]|nr:DegT/DnrJ/EryC1/StrS family aminotransferase [Bacillota bacterium]